MKEKNIQSNKQTLIRYIVFNARFIQDNLNCFEIDTGILLQNTTIPKTLPLMLFRCGYDIFIYYYWKYFTFIYGKFYLKLWPLRCRCTRESRCYDPASMNKFIVVRNHGDSCTNPNDFYSYSFYRVQTVREENRFIWIQLFWVCDRERIRKVPNTSTKILHAAYIWFTQKNRATVESDRIGSVGNWMNGFIELKWIELNFAWVNQNNTFILLWRCSA